MRRFFTALAVLMASIAVSAQNLTILHMNDTHSHMDPERSGKHAGKGGVIEQAAYIDSVRVADGKDNVLLVHAGDFSQGTSYFTELGGDLEIDVLNAMEFDVTCLGNHEFDNGMEELARRLRNLKVPVVCANYDFTGSPIEGLVKPYVILEKAGKKIGVIGLLTDVTSVVNVEIANSMKYSHPVGVTNRLAEELKVQKGCDLVVCLTHLGFEGEDYNDTELAAKVRYVDVIVGGHSHTHLDDLVKVADLDGVPVTIVTDGKWGLDIGNLKVSFKSDLLYRRYLELRSDDLFSMDGSWFPYPEYEDRKGWDDLLGEYKSQYINGGEKYLDYQWKNVPATAYLGYERTGNRTRMESPLKDNRIALSALILAELAEGQGRFLDQLIDGVWEICQMPSWVLSAHLPRQSSGRSLPDPRDQIIDLGSAPLASQIAVTWHFFRGAFDKVDPVISYVMQNSVKEKILDPYLDHEKFYPNWWLSFVSRPGHVINNWNPWCNSDTMLCFLLMEEDPVRRTKAIIQSLRSVDLFIDYVKKDGACEEGPAYWGHAAGKLYDFLSIMHHASRGRFDVFDNKQIKAMGEYISRSFVQDGWVVNFADASAKLSYSPAVIYNYGKAVASQEMMDFAIYNLASPDKDKFVTPKPASGHDIFRALESIRATREMSVRTAEMNGRISNGESFESCLKSLRAAVPAYVWYPETEFYYMRTGDWFFAAKGGHNGESHNHNDIGTCILYINGIPMLVDAGVGTYTKQTFSSDRYSIWSMQSDWHNLPIINGTSQVFGRWHKSADVKAAPGSFSLDITGGYSEAADCRSLRRQYTIKGKTLNMVDTYDLKSRHAADVENIMVQGEVLLPGDVRGKDVVKAGEVYVINRGVTLKITYPRSLAPSVEVKELGDPRLTKVWGDTLKRISFTGKDDAPLKGKYVFTFTEL